MNGWTAFWLLCAVAVICDFAVFRTGADSILWQYRTPPELILQQELIAKRKATP